MKRFLIFVFCVFSLLTYAQNEVLRFNPQNFDEARKALSPSGQIIFVTATADWCQPCHLMEQSVFVDSRVASFFNKNFYNLKINIEKGQGSVFALQYEIDTLPSLLFLTSDGTVLSRSSGYKSAQQLVSLGQYAMNPALLDQAVIARYESGDRKPEFIINYLKRLPTLDQIKVINEYLANKKSWSDVYSLQILFKLPDSLLVSHYDLLTNNKNEYEKFIGESVYADKIRNLVDQKLYCSTDAITLELAEKIIQSSKLKDAKQITANYKYYYYKVIKKDIDLYAKSLAEAWSLSKNILKVDEFNEELKELIEYQIKTDIYKSVHKIVKKNKALFGSPHTNDLMATFASHQGYNSKQKYWTKRLTKLS